MNKKVQHQDRYQRKGKTRNIKPRILIVCQGEKTEPNYFQGMKRSERLGSVNIRIRPKPIDPCGMIRHIIKLKTQKEYDQIWCIFDIDESAKENVDDAFALAKKEKISIAYSNEAFELWYILHYEYLNIAINRKKYCKKLSANLKFPYKKNDESMYEILLDKQDIAIGNSEKLLKRYNKFDPFNSNPSTTVHTLIIELRKYT